MNRRRIIIIIIHKGEVPFCEIFPGNTDSPALFKGLGFVEEEELHVLLLKHDSEQYK